MKDSTMFSIFTGLGMLGFILEIYNYLTTAKELRLFPTLALMFGILTITFIVITIGLIWSEK